MIVLGLSYCLACRTCFSSRARQEHHTLIVTLTTIRLVWSLRCIPLDFLYLITPHRSEVLV